MSDWVAGIDISNYQSLTPARARDLAAGGVQLVIVRASHERQALIDTARAQMAMVVEAGMALHAYGWVYFTEDAASTAQYWRDIYADQPIGRFWIDCEETQYVKDPGVNRLWLSRALAVLQETWPVGIYSGRWWWEPYMGNTPAFASLPLWDADYTGVPTLTPPYPLYGGWTRRAIHQYDGRGSLAGISPLDLDAVDPALLGENTVTDEQMAEVQRIARDEVIRNIKKALAVPKMPAAARTALVSGALPAAQTLARGLQPGEGDGG